MHHVFVTAHTARYKGGMKHLVLLSCVTLAACANTPFKPTPTGPVDAALPAPGDALRPVPRPEGLDTSSLISAPPPPPAARTVEQFDTTSSAERAEAASAPAPAAEVKLGSTIASLGDVTQPGFWLKTPLVTEQADGRVVYPASGKSAQVALLPLEGPATAGSQISLPAMRLIEAPLTDLPTLDVFQSP